MVSPIAFHLELAAFMLCWHAYWILGSCMSCFIVVRVVGCSTPCFLVCGSAMIFPLAFHTEFGFYAVLSCLLEFWGLVFVVSWLLDCLVLYSLFYCLGECHDLPLAVRFEFGGLCCMCSHVCWVFGSCISCFKVVGLFGVWPASKSMGVFVLYFVSHG